ncbi:unnamed protein product [Pseudo-nitzschia multistriata]|uniref:RxLR effector protein n=1 Tax=Pseudo-nitzschia multistriata TaxID=183589 RepID=A0A448ZHD9_9STRA|nr:unnamed protein product [Pseudo-nitzschia multistriata]
MMLRSNIFLFFLVAFVAIVSGSQEAGFRENVDGVGDNLVEDQMTRVLLNETNTTASGNDDENNGENEIFGIDVGKSGAGTTTTWMVYLSSLLAVSVALASLS